MLRCSFALAFTGMFGVFRLGSSCLGISIKRISILKLEDKLNLGDVCGDKGEGDA
jgi:hypothetical protein